MTTLDELTAVLQRIAETAAPAVVGIGHRRGAGSGVVIARDTILTNAHNVRVDAPVVRLQEGAAEEAQVLAVDPDNDLAVLRAGTGDVAPLPWAADPRPRIGTPVFAVSRSRTGAAARVTFGTVAATERRFRGPRSRPIAGAFEHTAPLARGASGGPVLSATGELLGLNTHRLGEGFYLAIPADATLRARVDDLAAGASPRQRRLGVALAPPHIARRLRAAVGLPERDGLLVQQVFDDTPAAAADLRRGDLIVAVDGTPADTVDTLYEVLGGQAPEVTLGLVRGSDDLEVVVHLEG